MNFFYDDFVLILLLLVMWNILYIGYNLYICFGWIKEVNEFYYVG